ncbi:ABC transporter substrate-binding protein [Rhodococcus erythropolis]|uniref:ABC transporter substrate-binding protein n=1 Tax=Rhodococcus erythropolis TaxID=1833 RepID=UPI0030141A21
MSNTLGNKRIGTSRRNFLRLAGAGAAVAAAAPLLAACSTPEPGAVGANGLRKYRIVLPSKDPLVVFSVSYLAEDKGFYKDEGLEIERVLLLGGPAALTGLLSGAADALIATPGETLSAAAKGQDLTVVMGHTNSMPSTFVISQSAADRAGVRADSPLEQRKMALGRIDNARFGITSPGSQTDAFTRMAIAQAGMSNSDARIVPLQTVSNCLAALQNGDIDGYVGVPPAGEQAAEQAGAVVLLTAQAGDIEGAQSLQGMTSVVKQRDLASQKDLYEAALRAETKAMKLLNDNPDEAGALLRETRFGTLAESVWTAAWGSLAPSLTSPIVTPVSLNAWLDNGLVDGGSVTSQNFSTADLIDMGMVEAATNSLGWTPN